MLNAVWILTAQAGFLVLSGVVIVALLATLMWTFRALMATRPRNAVEGVVLDGTMGLYLGWVSVASIANIASILTASGFQPGTTGRDAWAVALLAVAGLVGAVLALRDGGRLAPSAAIAWGLAWVAVGRLTGELLSTPAAVAAIVAAAAVGVVTLVARARAGGPDGSPRVPRPPQPASSTGPGRPPRLSSPRLRDRRRRRRASRRRGAGSCGRCPRPAG